MHTAPYSWSRPGPVQSAKKFDPAAAIAAAPPGPAFIAITQEDRSRRQRVKPGKTVHTSIRAAAVGTAGTAPALVCIVIATRPGLLRSLTGCE